MSNKRTREKRRRWMRALIAGTRSRALDLLTAGYKHVKWSCVATAQNSATITAQVSRDGIHWREVPYADLCDATIENTMLPSGRLTPQTGCE